MATPRRNTVDYFPHIIGYGKKMDFIEKRYGNDGYATWFKILESLASTDNHYLNLNDNVEVSFLSAKCNVDEDRLLEIINDLVRLEVFNKQLWDYRIIWSEFFINSIQDAYKRRSAKPFDFLSLCKHLARNNIVNVDILHSYRIHNDNNVSENENNCDEIVYNDPQSKVEYSIVKETRERENNKTTPTPTQKFSFPSKQPIETLKKNCAGYSEWLTVIAKKNSLNMLQVLEWLDAFEIHILGMGKTEETESEFKKFFNAWITSEIRLGRKPKVENQSKDAPKKTVEQIAQEVIIKKYGNRAYES